MDINDISGHVVDCAIQVHRELGPGLLESTYRACLTFELAERGLGVLTEVPVPLVYKGIHLPVAYRLDLLVDDCVIVEVKAIAKLTSLHEAQLLSQLKLSGRRVGLLINFHVPLLKDGIVRRVR